MSRCVLALIASAWLLPGGTAQADGPHRVGVVVGVRVNVPEPRAEAVVRTIQRVLERELAVAVVTAGGAAIERDLPPGCATDAVCLSGLAARVEVDELLFLVVIGAGDRVRVEFSRRHPVTGEVSHPPALILDPEPEQMDRQIAAMVAQLLPGATARQAAEPRRSAAAGRPVVAVKPSAASAGDRKRAAGLVVAASGLAIAGGGVFFAFRARSAADELNQRHPADDPGTWSAKDESLEDAHYRHRTWATVLGVAGGVAVATGATLYLLGLRDRRRASDERLSLEVGGDGGALVWKDSF